MLSFFRPHGTVKAFTALSVLLVKIIVRPDRRPVSYGDSSGSPLTQRRRGLTGRYAIGPRLVGMRKGRKRWAQG
jgi:hypothetical protein